MESLHNTGCKTSYKGLYVLGNLTLDDIVVYETGTVYLGLGGGNAVYSAIGGRVWLDAVSLLSRRGLDYPQENVEQMKAVGIQPFLKQVSYPDIHNWALYEAHGARQFVNHLASGTHYQLSITGEEIPASCLDGAAYHIAPMPIDIVDTIVERLRHVDALLSLDPHLEYLHTKDFNRQAYAILPHLDFFLPSREEAAALYGKDDPEAAARDFGKMGVPVVAIKMNVEGSLLYVTSTEKMYYIPICEVQTVDPTGAGDAYCGGFLAGYLETGDPLQAACYGTVSASFVVQHRGALDTFKESFHHKKERLDTLLERVTVINSVSA